MSKVQFEKNSFDNKRIVVFDGECAFCNESVVFIRKRNAKNNLWFCSSQSGTANDLINYFDITVSAQDSLIYIKNGKPYYFSSAALEIAKELDNFWAMLSIFLIVPTKVRDRIYRFIAKHRKSIMGTSDHCSIENSKLFNNRVLK